MVRASTSSNLVGPIAAASAPQDLQAVAGIDDEGRLEERREAFEIACLRCLGALVVARIEVSEQVFRRRDAFLLPSLSRSLSPGSPSSRCFPAFILLVKARTAPASRAVTVTVAAPPSGVIAVGMKAHPAAAARKVDGGSAGSAAGRRSWRARDRTAVGHLTSASNSAISRFAQCPRHANLSARRRQRGRIVVEDRGARDGALLQDDLVDAEFARRGGARGVEGGDFVKRRAQSGVSGGVEDQLGEQAVDRSWRLRTNHPPRWSTAR